MSEGTPNVEFCSGCGAVLTAEEVEYYSTTCDRCERKWLAQMQRDHKCGGCQPLPSGGNSDD